MAEKICESEWCSFCIVCVLDVAFSASGIFFRGTVACSGVIYRFNLLPFSICTQCEHLTYPNGDKWRQNRAFGFELLVIMCALFFVYWILCLTRCVTFLWLGFGERYGLVNSFSCSQRQHHLS